MDEPGTGETATDDVGLTRLDRMRRWGSDHPLLAPLSLLLGVLAVLGGVFGFGKDVYELFGSDPEATTATSVIRPADPPPELDLAANPRFGFAFSHPRGWARQDAVNGDGNQLESQDGSGAVLVASGSHIIDDPSPDDPDLALAAEVEQTEGFIREGGGKVLESGYFGLYEETVDGAQVSRSQIPGWRLLVEQPAAAGGAVTSIEVMTRWGGRNVHMSCAAPTERFADVRGLCNELVSTLTLDGAWQG